MKKWIPLMLAAVFGTVAALLTVVYLQKQNASLGASQTYLVAKKRIARGELFESGNVGTRQMPKKYAPLNALRPADRGNIYKTAASLDIQPGQILLWDYVEAGLEGSGLSDLLEKGERALAIGVDNLSGLEGMIRPNDRVDVLGTFSVTSGARQKTVTSCVVQNITVLAVGNGFGKASRGNYASVTLKVTPQEAEILTFAEQHGRLRLILRGRSDLRIHPNLPKVDFSNVITLEKRATHKRAGRKPRVTYD